MAASLILWPWPTQCLDSGGVTFVPAFAGLGAPHWDRNAHALISGMSEATGRAHLARAAVDSISHQICDIVDVIEERSSPLQVFRADGGATSPLVVQTKPTFSAERSKCPTSPKCRHSAQQNSPGGRSATRGAWPTGSSGRRYRPIVDPDERRRRREHWAGEINRTRFTPSARSSVNGL